jgi:hypothetical protein
MTSKVSDDLRSPTGARTVCLSRSTGGDKHGDEHSPHERGMCDQPCCPARGPRVALLLTSAGRVEELE